jgi:glycosyltransferase involved in cell wall biosynthesis
MRLALCHPSKSPSSMTRVCQESPTNLDSLIKKTRFTPRALVSALVAPQFSIVTPSFLQPQYLRLCSASVLDQGGVTVEHIIQEGGGVGGLDGCWPSDPRVHLCAEPDSGMYDAVNRGFSKARGLILGHLNADEQYLPDTLSTVWQVFEDNPDLDVLFGDVVLLNSHWIPVSYRRVIMPNELHTKRVHLGTMTCSTFFRRRLLDKNLLYPTEWKTIGDAVLVLKWLKSGVTMQTIHRPPGGIRIHRSKSRQQCHRYRGGQAVRWAAQDELLGRPCSQSATPDPKGNSGRISPPRH